MSFAEGTKVIYKGKDGVIDFVDSQYVVVRWNEVAGENPARLIVYPDYYDRITLLKSSQK